MENIGDNAFRECTNLELLVRMYNLGRGLSDQGTRIFPNTVKGIFIPALVTDLQEDDLDDFNFMKHVFYEGSKSNMERTFHTAFNTTYDDNTTLFGIWGFGSNSRIHWYSTVTFDMQGVLANTTREQVWSGWDTVECPTAPTAKGYDFGGWYKDEACTEPFGTTEEVEGVSVTSGTIAGDISIYAKWIPHTNNVICFNTGGRGTTPASQTLTSGETVTVPAGQSYNDGSHDYIIEGWYTDDEYKDRYDFSTKVNDSMTLYAQWVVATGQATITTTGGDSNCLVTLTDAIGQTYSTTSWLMPGIYTLTVTPASGYSFKGSYMFTNRSSHASEMKIDIAGSATKTYTLDLTENDADVNVDFITQPILTVTKRADDASVLNKVTWSVVNNQDASTSYDNGDNIPVSAGEMVATNFGIRMTVDLGTLGSEYAYTATVSDRGSGQTTKHNSLQGTSFLIQPKGSIDIDLYAYQKPTIELQNAASNSTTLTQNEGIVASSITLTNRTLWKDGSWNTLCLPFDVKDGNTADDLSFTDTPLEGATVMSLKTSKNDGSGFDNGSGTLTLIFNQAKSITAGIPYIVKWDKPAYYEGNESTYDISDPTFTNVAISRTEPSSSTSKNKVSFIGTFSPVLLQKNTTSNLYIGADDKLYYPNVDNYYVNACRAYFQVDLEGSAGVRQFVLNFGDDKTVISDATRLNDKGQMINDSWYSLDGRKLDGKPTAKGLYIHGGKKVTIP